MTRTLYELQDDNSFKRHDYVLPKIEIERSEMNDVKIKTNAEIDANIVALQAWIAAHKPREDWSRQHRQAYHDRLMSLAQWIAKSQIVNR
jgi:hypothetical protein